MKHVFSFQGGLLTTCNISLTLLLFNLQQVFRLQNAPKNDEDYPLEKMGNLLIDAHYNSNNRTGDFMVN